MKFRWRIPDKASPVSADVLQATGGKTLLATILTRRGYTDPLHVKELLYPEMYSPSPAHDLPDLMKGVERIEKAIEYGEQVLVWGDFDVDGQTSTSLLYSALKRIGAKVVYHIPIREKESHGIRPEFLKPYLDQGLQVLLTCDTGIAAHDAIDLANENGVDVIITDHHDCPAVLPNAFALINPKRFTNPHPLSSLPGVGVAYKFVEALYERAGLTHDLPAFLDLVALGIVADLAHLTDDTRFLLQKGLEALRQTGRPGLLQLLENARVDKSHLIDEHIGFQLGPRLNAVGRLADANISVPLLITEDREEAREIAEQLERLNEERRYQTDLVYASAIEQIEKDPSLLQYAVLVLAHPTWHQGVIGIVASRVVEEFGKPSILFSAPQGKAARGSARSIEGYNITEAISTQSEYLNGFGGHPMAAGLSLPVEFMDRFRRGVSKAIIGQRTGVELEPTLEIDAEVKLGDLSDNLIDELELLAPFGPGNPPIQLMCSNLRVLGEVIIGKDKAHRKLVVQDEDNHRKEVLWWNSVDETIPAEVVDIVIRARPGYFRGERQQSLTLQDIRVSGVRIEAKLPERQVKIVDYRYLDDPERSLQELVRSHPDLQVWAEGEAERVNGIHREQLSSSKALVLWTVPPSQLVLSQYMRTVDPNIIYVFANTPALDSFNTFMRRLVGLIKYTMQQYEGETTVLKLAAAMAHTEKAIRYALPLLTKLGIMARVEKGGQVYIEPHSSEGAPAEEDQLLFEIAEAKAFRALLKKSRDLSNFLLADLVSS